MYIYQYIHTYIQYICECKSAMQERCESIRDAIDASTSEYEKERWARRGCVFFLDVRCVAGPKPSQKVL